MTYITRFRTLTDKDNQCIIKIMNFITNRHNSFSLVDQEQVIKFTTGKYFSMEEANYKLGCITKGRKQYDEFRD